MERREEIDGLIEENRARSERLKADYDPVTGKDAPGDRVKIVIPDFAIPEQHVPEEMLHSRLVKRIVKCGSIKKYLSSYSHGASVTYDSIEYELRRIRHRYDFAFWAYFNITIEDKEGRGPVRFKLNYAQIKVLDECERLRKAGLPINIIICKARQWGGSTLCFFYQVWIALKWRPSHSFSICAQTNGVASSIKRMLEYAFEHYKAWDLDLPVSESVHLAKLPDGNEYVVRDSRDNQVRRNIIRIGSIIAPDNLRGLPGSGAHFSEVGIWPDTPARRPEDLMKSISGGILLRPYTVQAIESTPKGTGNAFHRMYKSAKAGSSSYHAVFIPWFYIPHDTLPVEDHAEFAEWLYDHRLDESPNGRWKDSGRYYWYLWTAGATFEGINWYRNKRMQYDDFSDMASEAPSNDIEAFQHSGSKVFSIYDVERLRERCTAPPMEGFLVSDAEKGARVLDNVRFVPTEGGALKIWAAPDRTPMRDRYLVTVDVGGRGKDSDWSVIRVLDRFPMMFGGKPRMVATMRYHTDYDLLAYDAMRIAGWYDDALLVIEKNTLENHNQDRDAEGYVYGYILDIISKIYDNLYANKTDSDSIREGKPTRWGFSTNVKTKPELVANLITCVREGLWEETYGLCCDELSLYEKNARGQYEAAPGKGNHDDILMATAIALWVCFNEMERPAFVDTTPRHQRKVDMNSTSHI